MPSDESKGSQLDAIGSLAQRQLDNTVEQPTVTVLGVLRTGSGRRMPSCPKTQTNSRLARRAVLIVNTDTKLLIYGLFQKGRVLAQDGIGVDQATLPCVIGWWVSGMTAPVTSVSGSGRHVSRFSWKMTVLKIIYAHEKRSCHEQTTSYGRPR